MTVATPQPVISEIRAFAGATPPAGWLACDGSLHRIADYEPLFNLIGTTYGGDGQETFGVPDLAQRIPVHQSPTLELGAKGGSEEHTLTIAEMATHLHMAHASQGWATRKDPTGAIPASVHNNWLFYLVTGTPNTVELDLAPDTITPVGGSMPHANVMPTISITYGIATTGIFPTT